MAEKVLLDVLESYLDARVQHHNDKNQKVFDNKKVGKFFMWYFCQLIKNFNSSMYLLPEITYFQKLCGWLILYFN